MHKLLGFLIKLASKKPELPGGNIHNFAWTEALAYFL
jgi:hypothetical protein